jgi:hypothetical protein
VCPILDALHVSILGDQPCIYDCMPSLLLFSHTFHASILRCLLESVLECTGVPILNNPPLFLSSAARRRDGDLLIVLIVFPSGY